MVRIPSPVTRETFLAKAPMFYAMGIVEVLRQITGSITTTGFAEVLPDGYQNTATLVPCHDLVLLACAWLRDRGVVDLIEMEFGPPVVEPTADFAERLQGLCQDRATPFYVYGRVHNRPQFLAEALQELDVEQDRLRIDGQDFRSVMMPESGRAVLMNGPHTPKKSPKRRSAAATPANHPGAVIRGFQDQPS